MSMHNRCSKSPTAVLTGSRGRHTQTAATLLFLPRAKKAAGNPDTSSGSSNGSGNVQQAGLIDGVSQIGDFFEFISDPNTWLRLGMLVAGGTLVLVALFQISGQGSKAAAMVNTVTDVLPQTRAVKGAAKAVKAAG